MTQAIKIEYVPLGSLNPAPYNPRKVDEDALARLVSGIKEFGLVDPLIARRSDRLLIGGHQRLKALELCGHAEAPVVFLDDIDDNRAAALNVLLNNPAAQGTWDMKLLGEILSELDAHGLDATITGFSEEAIEKVLTWTGDGEPPETNLDPGEGRYKEQYGIIVLCADEAAQERTFKQLKDLGYPCKVVVT